MVTEEANSNSHVRGWEMREQQKHPYGVLAHYKAQRKPKAGNVASMSFFDLSMPLKEALEWRAKLCWGLE